LVDIARCAKEEYGLKLSEPAQKRIRKRFDLDSGGITIESAQDVKVALGTEREIARDRTRQLTALERLKAVEGVRPRIPQRVAAVAQTLADAEKAIALVESIVDDLRSRSQTMSPLLIKTAADEIDNSDLAQGRAAVQAVHKHFEAVAAELSRDSPQFRAAISDAVYDEAKHLSSRIGRLEKRVKRCMNVLERFWDKARRIEGLPPVYLVKFQEARSYEEIVAEAISMQHEKEEAARKVLEAARKAKAEKEEHARAIAEAKKATEAMAAERKEAAAKAQREAFLAAVGRQAPALGIAVTSAPAKQEGNASAGANNDGNASTIAADDGNTSAVGQQRQR